MRKLVHRSLAYQFPSRYHREEARGIPPAEYTPRRNICHYLLVVWRPNCRRLHSLLANRLHKINNTYKPPLNSVPCIVYEPRNIERQTVGSKRNSRRFFFFYCFSLSKSRREITTFMAILCCVFKQSLAFNKHVSWSNCNLYNERLSVFFLFFVLLISM